MGEKVRNVYTLITGALLAIAFFLLGLELDMAVIWSVVKRPIGPGIGMLCQFFVMPLCAYGMAKAFLDSGKLLRVPSNRYRYVKSHICLII